MEKQNQNQAPVSIKEWIIIFILSALPIVNIVMLFVWAFGGNANKSVENWAKASLLLFIFVVVLFGIIALLGVIFYQM